MEPKSRKTKPKPNSLDAALRTTRLRKLAVEAILSPEKSGKGNLQLAYKAVFENIPTEENIVVVHLSIKGEGLSGGEETEGKIAFTIDAAIDGGFALSRKPEEGEMKGREKELANYLIPALIEMIETLLAKCGYSGSLPRSMSPK